MEIEAVVEEQRSRQVERGRFVVEQSPWTRGTMYRGLRTSRGVR
jgi:hypothetical protein